MGYSKKTKIILIFILIVIVLIAIIYTMSNPLRRSPIDIRERTLTLTPIGTSKEEVIVFIENSNGRVTRVSEEFGYFVEWGYPSNNPQGAIVGVQSLGAIIGKYRICLVVTIAVEVFWGFDEEGRLLDLDVRKTTMK